MEGLAISSTGKIIITTTDCVHQHQGTMAILSYRKSENLREVFQSDQKHSHKRLSQGLAIIFAFN